MKRLVLFISIFLLVSVAFAHWVPEDGHKMHFPQLPDELGWDVNATQPMILADDFMCTETGFIKDIHFWGSWKNGVEGQIIEFVLSIHEDIPVSDTIPYSRPGLTLWEAEITDFLVQPFDPPTMEGWYDPASGEIIPSSIGNYFQYNVFLPENLWFPQDSGTIYWLNISVIVDDPINTQWGWKSTQDHWNDDAVWATWGNLNWIDIFEPGGDPTYYIPGDVNGDGVVDQADYDYLVDYLMQGGPPPPYIYPNSSFYAAADVNGDCMITSTDVTYLFVYLNSGGSPPTFCPTYPPGLPPQSLDLAFVITNGPQQDIPTLNEWGMLILGLLLLGAGTVAVIRRRRRVPAES